MFDVPDIFETRIDGVRTLWIDTPPPLTAVLQFRVGSWDEAPRMRGYTHLAEHLALSQFREVTYQHNGQVAGNHTAVWASGAPTDVSTHITRVCDALITLPMDRLDVEAGVLRAEAARQPFSSVQQILTAFFGDVGPGASGVNEWGLMAPDAENLTDWVSKHFVVENAVLTLDGPPPPELTLSALPTGVERGFRLAGDTSQYLPSEPLAVGSHPSSFSVGTLLARSTAAAVAVSLAGEFLTDRLRHQLGLAYSVAALYERLDATTASAFLVADCEPERSVEMGKAFLAALDDFASLGPDNASLDRIRVRPDPEAIDPLVVARGELARRANDLLMGYEPRSIDDLFTERDLLTADEIKQELTYLVEQSYAIVPPAEPTLVKQRKVMAGKPVVGPVFKPNQPAADQGLRGLVVGDDGITLNVDDESFTVGWDDVTIAVDHGDSFEIHERTGHFLRIVPGEWRESDRLDELIRENLRDEVIVEGRCQSSAVDTQGVDAEWTEDTPPTEPVRRKSPVPHLGVERQWTPPGGLVSKRRRLRPSNRPGNPLPVVPLVFAVLLFVVGVVLVTLAFSTENGRGQEYVNSVAALGVLSVCGGGVVLWRASGR